MKWLRVVVLLVPVAGMLAVVGGCVSSGSGKKPNEYYRRGSIHRDSFPAGYSPGRTGTYGRPHRY